MAYCLRDLPPDARALIDEMGQHLRDLEQLKAVGGTPSARCVKAFKIAQTWNGVHVSTRDPRNHHIRMYKRGVKVKDPCNSCKSIGWSSGQSYHVCDTCGFRPTHSKVFRLVYLLDRVRGRTLRELASRRARGLGQVRGELF